MKLETKNSEPETTIKEKPILFSGAMVRAILRNAERGTGNAEPKTQTRRVFKLPKWAHPHDKGDDIAGETPQICHRDSGCLVDVPCPYGSVGDRLWVKETFAPHPDFDHETIYRADRGGDYQGAAQGDFVWKPSIFMPRKRSRITLEIQSVRVERLQEISKADVLAEGTPGFELEKASEEEARACYRGLWESINGAGSWDKNPWVWVIEFGKV